MQLTSTRMVCPVPLIPLPVMEVPFHRIGMYVVGPLPRSRTGNRFVLVVVDYATRYPEAIPHRTVDAEQVAEALMGFFSTVGIPVEILTDQGSNFMSKLLKEVYHLMGVKPICTSPYHPQTDGFVERFNQTLKAMLRRSAEEGKDWDKLPLYVLFAYREVPQETTGFSPFELLYGREVRGPLDVIRETWEADVSSRESVVSYVVGMRERLEAMAELVKENVGKAQRRQKEWFDRQARERELKVGEKVLILLPTSASKLLAKWQGPFVVKGRKGRVNYEVDMGERRKKCRTFHINMLKPWVEYEEMSLWASEENVGESCEKKEEEEIATREEGTSIKRKPKWGTELDVEKKREMEEVLREFEDVLSGGTERTGLVKHDIDVKGSKPISLSPYRVPHIYRGWMRGVG